MGVQFFDPVPSHPRIKVTSPSDRPHEHALRDYPLLVCAVMHCCLAVCFAGGLRRRQRGERLQARIAIKTVDKVIAVVGVGEAEERHEAGEHGEGRIVPHGKVKGK